MLYTINENTPIRIGGKNMKKRNSVRYPFRITVGIVLLLLAVLLVSVESVFAYTEDGFTNNNLVKGDSINTNTQITSIGGWCFIEDL